MLVYMPKNYKAAYTRFIPVGKFVVRQYTKRIWIGGYRNLLLGWRTWRVYRRSTLDDMAARYAGKQKLTPGDIQRTQELAKQFERPAAPSSEQETG